MYTHGLDERYINCNNMFFCRNKKFNQAMSIHSLKLSLYACKLIRFFKVADSKWKNDSNTLLLVGSYTFVKVSKISSKVS